MSHKYKITDQDAFYFVTFTTVDWVDVFTRDKYRNIIIESLQYCQQKKGLQVGAWCIMSNHVHLIIGTTSSPMQNIMRDLKSYTSRRLREEITAYPKESRKKWLLSHFDKGGVEEVKHRWQLWQNGHHPIELFDSRIIEQKLNYIHNNPVKAGWVFAPEDYVWSSARDYAGEQGMLEIYFLT